MPQGVQQPHCEIRWRRRYLLQALSGKRAVMAPVPCEKRSVNLNRSYNGMADPSQMLFYSVYLDIYPFHREDVELILKCS